MFHKMIMCANGHHKFEGGYAHGVPPASSGRKQQSLDKLLQQYETGEVYSVRICKHCHMQARADTKGNIVYIIPHRDFESASGWGYEHSVTAREYERYNKLSSRELVVFNRCVDWGNKERTKRQYAGLNNFILFPWIHNDGCKGFIEWLWFRYGWYPWPEKEVG